MFQATKEGTTMTNTPQTAHPADDAAGRVPYFISTAIPYVNARPHIGFALEISRPTLSRATTGSAAKMSTSSPAATRTA